MRHKTRTTGNPDFVKRLVLGGGGGGGGQSYSINSSELLLSRPAR
jgi:hypothetical protein